MTVWVQRPSLSGAVAVAGFQLRRLLTPPRLAMALLGAIFPAAVMLAAGRASRGRRRTMVAKFRPSHFLSFLSHSRQVPRDTGYSEEGLLTEG